MPLFSRRTSHEQPPRRRSVSVSPSIDATPPQRSFVRNRTLAARDSLEATPSPRTKAHDLSRQRRRVGLVFMFLVVIGVLTLLFLMQFTSRVTIAVGQLSIQRALDQKGYIDTINHYFDKHPVERLRFSLSADQLLEFVVARHPEVRQIRQSTVWGIGQTQFTVDLRQPVAGWELGGRQYYVDDQGVAFDKNYFDTPSVKIVDNSGLALEQGTAVTSTRFLGFIGKIVALAKEKGRVVTRAVLPVGTAREVDIYLADTNPFIKFSIDRGAGEQVEDMDRSLSYLTSKSISASYVDVRVEGRAFYQ